MTYVVITVAGLSDRFNKGEQKPALKCIYHEGDVKKTLLHSILRKCKGCKGVIVVGGYQFSELQKYVDSQRGGFPFEIDVVYNLFYETYGSGYSLKVGLQECCKKKDCTEVIFAEGDLLFDEETMFSIISGRKNYLTINDEPILSKKAVAVYFNGQGEIKYLYNTEHGLFHLQEPFSAIYNSGQVWKFAEWDKAEHIIANMEETDWHGTNLKFIERFFHSVAEENVEMLKFSDWINCNTRADYLKCKKYL